MNNTMSMTWRTEPSVWLPPSSITLPLALFLLLQYVVGCCKRPCISKASPKPWAAYDWPAFGSSIRFFAKRVDMALEGRNSSASGAFSMFIGTKHVVVLSGQAGRKTFFGTRGLSLPQGFVELLTGKLSSAKDGDYGFSYFSKTFMELIRGPALADRVAILNSDIHTFSNKLRSSPITPKPSGWRNIDVSSSVPLLIFKLMHRVVGATEIAQDDHLLQKTFSTFLKFERSTSNARVVFPWLMTPLYFLRLFSATMLYVRVLRIVNRRQKEGRREDDALQILTDKGETAHQVAEFVCTALAAGVATTSCTTLWLLTFLAHSPEWRAKCRDEVLKVVAARRSQGPSPSSDPGFVPQTAHSVLAGLTLQEWESEFPVLGNCLRETLRLSLPGTVFRRNASGADVPIGSSGEVIPQGAYAAYAIADVHQDPQLYPDPHVFDPSRWTTRIGADPEPGSEEDGPIRDTYLGFGAGRHTCAGMRLAKLQINMVLAHILSNFDIEPANVGGAEVVMGEGMPVPDRNIARLMIPEQPTYLRFKPLP